MITHLFDMTPQERHYIVFVVPHLRKAGYILHAQKVFTNESTWHAEVTSRNQVTDITIEINFRKDNIFVVKNVMPLNGEKSPSANYSEHFPMNDESWKEIFKELGL